MVLSGSSESALGGQATEIASLNAVLPVESCVCVPSEKVTVT